MLKLLRARATARGLLGGSKPWTIVWTVLLAARLIRRLTKDKPEVVFSSKLEPGQAFVISTRDREPVVYGGPAPSP